MKPETRIYLDLAKERLDDAVKTTDMGMFRVAAREAYLAALNASRALIFEAQDRTSKTHSGTRTLMHELLAQWPPVSREALDVLTTGFDQKTVADYGTLMEAERISAEDARATLAAATELLRQIETALKAV